jgi:type I restriction enzyme M protein
MDALTNIEKLEASLWDAADNLRANSKLTSSEYCMPVLGVIFLRHATNRYDAVIRQIEADKASGKIPKGTPITRAHFISRRALLLPREARYDELLKLPKGTNLGTALIEAMNAIEKDFKALEGQLPKDYEKFENDLLEDLLRIFDSETLRTASGDVFGRIYEYFLMKFAMQGAQDNGEFFTPPSLVQTIVNVIEPDHGVVFDPACGSGGMFVQSSHFIEGRGEDTAHRVTFFGQEKTGTTIRLTKMNLAVHGLEGDIREANTFYDDVHRLSDGQPLWANCDFVMANPPFNVDKVDAEKIKTDRRLPFGLPGVNKDKKVSNGNYLWISYFHSYLGPKGRAGFVMSSQASSSGHGEMEVRRKLVQTGDVDVMISIRSNFFYTRTVPCELWHLDKGKPAARRDQVLMIDARNIYRKVNRKIYDFTPEQLQNLSAIVWLYRGESDRFLKLVKDYLAAVGAHSAEVAPVLTAFEAGLDALGAQFDPLAKAIAKLDALDAAKKQAFIDALAEWRAAFKPYTADRARLLKDLETFRDKLRNSPRPLGERLGVRDAIEALHAARKAFEPAAERTKGLIKQADLLYKLAARVVAAAIELPLPEGEGRGEGEVVFDARGARKLVKDLDEQRHAAVEQLRLPAYFHRQAAWLLDRFPGAKLVPVPGFVKLVDRKAIEAADWSLTPGRYVGVAPAEVDEDFDFDQTLTDIHVELADLNQESVALAKKIQKNFEDIGA